MCGWAFSAPFSVNAITLSDLITKTALASEESTSTSEELSNSQNIELLEASVSPILVLEGKEAEEEAIINIVSDVALLPAVSPLGMGGDEYVEMPEIELGNMEIYVVKKGDSMSEIAKMFGITKDTIYSANEMKKGSAIKPGQVLLIPPYAGVFEEVEKGDTLGGIAKRYGVPVDQIIFYNELEDSKIVVGHTLFIPGGEILPEPVKKNNTNSTKDKVDTTSTRVYASGSVNKAKTRLTLNNTSGYFAHPLPGSKFSRGPGGSHYGTDYTAPTGTPILSAASGKVVFVCSGWCGAYGNVVFIDHPNGQQTRYAHMSKILVNMGESVEKGQRIGLVGNTGRSTGPHLHFEIR